MKIRIGAAAAPFGTDMTPNTEDKRPFYYQQEIINDNINKEISPIELFRTSIKKRGIRGMKNDDDYYYKFDLQEKENNELKKENKELYQKIIMYTHQIKNLKSKNNLYMSQLESFNTKKK